MTSLPRIGWFFAAVFLLTGCGSGMNETSLKISNDKKSAAAVATARMNGCLNCHFVTSSKIGPAWDLVSERYKNSDDAREFLINKVKKGGNGNWNKITGGALMPPHENRVTDEHIAQIVDFILSLKRDSNPSTPIVEPSDH